MRAFGKLAALALAIAIASPAAAQDAHSWDGLVRVKAKKVDAVYLQPNADFRGYTKVMLDPTEVAFRKNWRRDQNAEMGVSRDVSEADARRILDEAREGFEKIFRKAYADAGYEIVTAPGADVLRIGTAIVDLDVAAPDTMSAANVRTFTRDAGSATLFVEARDSVTGALLGRAVDADSIDDFGVYIRNRATNAGAFESAFERWAKISVGGLAELKQLSPVDAQGRLAKR